MAIVGTAFESADGKFLYFASDLPGSPLFRMPVGGGPEIQVAPAMVHPDGFTATGSGFAVTAKGVYSLSDPKTIQLLNEKTGQIRTVARLGKGNHAEGITVSPDNASLVFSQSDGRWDLMLAEGFK